MRAYTNPAFQFCPFCDVSSQKVIKAGPAVQAVAVSLEPKETGGGVQLNLAALDLGDAYRRASLPPVHTAMPSVSAFPSLPVTSEIQPAAPDSQQVTATFHGSGYLWSHLGGSVSHAQRPGLLFFYFKAT